MDNLELEIIQFVQKHNLPDFIIKTILEKIKQKIQSNEENIKTIII